MYDCTEYDIHLSPSAAVPTVFTNVKLDILQRLLSLLRVKAVALK